jgi:hypothetical protein
MRTNSRRRESARMDAAMNAKLEDIAIEVGGLLFECRIAMAAVHHGVEVLALRSTQPPIVAELQTLAKLSNQACDALELLQKAIVDDFS